MSRISDFFKVDDPEPNTAGDMVELFFDSGDTVLWRPEDKVDGGFLAGYLHGLLHKGPRALAVLDSGTGQVNVIRPDRIVRMVLHPGREAS